MAEVAYVSRVRIERLRGPERLASIPAEKEPIRFGVHGAVAKHYGVSPEISELNRMPRRSTTLWLRRVAD